MKKLIIIIVLTVLSTLSVFASMNFDSKHLTDAFKNSGFLNRHQGGFIGPNASPIPVDKAKALRNGTHVILRGYLEKSLGDHAYDFRDISSVGVIIVEINDKEWKGQKITPKDKVQIEGTVSKDWNSVEVQVENVVKLK